MKKHTLHQKDPDPSATVKRTMAHSLRDESKFRMYFLVVLVNLGFCVLLTLRMALRGQHAVRGTSTRRGKLAKTVATRRHGKEKEQQQLYLALRKSENSRRALQARAQQDRLRLEKASAKLEEERLTRSSLEARLRAAEARARDVEIERQSLENLLRMLCGNTGSIEKVLIEMKSARNILPDSRASSPSPEPESEGKTSASQSMDSRSIKSFESSHSSTLMRSCDSTASVISKKMMSSANSVSTDDFHDAYHFSAFEVESVDSD